MPLSPETERLYAEQAENYRIDPQQYRNEDGEVGFAVQVNERNFGAILTWVGDGDPWYSNSFVAGLAFGEYEDQVYVPFGWWVIQHGRKFEYLSENAFENEWTAC